MSVLLDADRVTYRVGSKALVTEASLTLAAGELTVVIGPNGAGKSTLVKLLSGELRPAFGTIRYGGEEIARVPPWRLACLRAVLPQASRLAFPFTVREVTRIGLDGIGRGLSRRDRTRILDEALVRADVAHLAERGYQSLSGGEQQRSQFARILAQLAAGRSVVPHQVLLLDEPVASLDLKHQLSLLEAAAAIARDGVAVLAVLHDLNLAAAFADELVVMQVGRIVASGSPSEVLVDKLIADVFEVDIRVGAVPAGPIPFILPRRQDGATRRHTGL